VNNELHEGISLTRTSYKTRTGSAMLS